MPYIHKIIGTDEKLVGIARLHWIYILKGTLLFLACIGFAMLVNGGVYFLMQRIVAATGNLAESATPFYAIQTWLTPVMVVIGLILLSFYVAKLITTEIGLTTSRLIHKHGFIFVKVLEIDINEISGEALDLGIFGRFLGYGYLNLDCRFIGDVQLPAIEHPERFVRVLHQLRADTTDTPSMAMGKHKSDQPATPPDDSAVSGFNLNTPHLKPDTPANNPEIVEQIVRQVHAEMIQLEHMPQPAPAVDAHIVADMVQKVMPQVVEQVAENLRAKGLLPEQPEITKPPEDALLDSFDKASGEQAKPPEPTAKDDLAKAIA